MKELSPFGACDGCVDGASRGAACHNDDDHCSKKTLATHQSSQHIEPATHLASAGGASVFVARRVDLMNEGICPALKQFAHSALALPPYGCEDQRRTKEVRFSCRQREAKRNELCQDEGNGEHRVNAMSRKRATPGV